MVAGGEVYGRIWEVEAAAGRDRFSPESPFRMLYKDNGHPSRGCGAFVMALTMIMSFTGKRLTHMEIDHLLTSNVTDGLVRTRQLTRLEVMTLPDACGSACGAVPHLCIAFVY